MLKSITTLLTFVTFTFAVVPELELRNHKINEVSTFVATTNIGSDNQLCLPLSIKASSVCVKNGTWILYPESNFMSTNPSNTLILQSIGGSENCMDLPPELDKSLGSYRPAGNVSGDLCTLNVYVGLGYTETENLYGPTGTPVVSFAFNSVVSSDPSCEWEFFMKEDFSGFSDCIKKDTADQFLPDFTKRFNVQAGDIKSIKAGCSKLI